MEWSLQTSPDHIIYFFGRHAKTTFYDEDVVFWVLYYYHLLVDALVV